MYILTLLLILTILLVSLILVRRIDSTTESDYIQFTNEQLQYIQRRLVYPILVEEIQSVHLNPSDDKSVCYQNGNRIYCMENIRPSDIESLQKEISVNGNYLKDKLQNHMHRQNLYGQAPKLIVIGMAIEDGKLIIVMELVQ